MLEKSKSEKPETFKIVRVMIIILCLHLAYSYYSSKIYISALIDNPDFTLLGPYNSSQNEVQDVYNQLIDIKNFTFLVNPQPCRGYTAGLLLVVVVSSDPSNYNKRNVIRNTWGRSEDSTKLVFLLGESANATTAQMVANESATHGDIVQGTFTDAYRNMTYKHVMGLKWVSHHCPTARYVLKTDDDVLVNTRKLRQFLVRDLSPWGARGLIGCKAYVFAPAQRTSQSKWKVTEQEYPSYYYPRYCSGGSILYSQDVVGRLLTAAQSANYFWIDDVHITGVIAEKLHIGRTQLSSLILSETRARVLMNRGVKLTGQFLFGPPELSTDRISDIWKAIPK